MNKYTLGLGVVLLALHANAVIVDVGDGSGNTTSTGAGGGWDYVGRIDKPGVYSSVTYLDNNWFITANHIKALDNPTGVILGGSSYGIDSGSWTRLSANGEDADLIMFRVTSNVGLSGVSVSSSSVANNAHLTMIGNGRDRATDLTLWDSNWNEVPSGGSYSGYKWDAGSTMRWGENTKERNSDANIDTGYGITDTFYTDFDAGEAQGATYDSGGGVFLDNGDLAGIMITVGGYSGQPGWPNNVSAFGNKTYIADLSTYSSQINDNIAIPEPSAMIFMVATPLAVLFIRRIFLI